MKIAVFTSALWIVFALSNVKSVWANHSPYVLDILKAKHPGFERVRLRHKVSGRTVWTRTVSGRREAHWSADHRAVAVETTHYILVWRAGQRLLTVKFPGGLRLGHSQGWDYSMGYVWSPDKQRLLVRFGASGSSTVGAAPLYCLKFGERHYKYLPAPTHNLVWNMTWQSNRTAVLWLYDENKHAPHQKPQQWRVP